MGRCRISEEKSAAERNRILEGCVCGGSGVGRWKGVWFAGGTEEVLGDDGGMGGQGGRSAEGRGVLRQKWLLPGRGPTVQGFCPFNQPTGGRIFLSGSIDYERLANRTLVGSGHRDKRSRKRR